MKKNVSSTLFALGFLTAGACAPESDEASMAEQQLVTRTAKGFLRSENPVAGQYIVVLKKEEKGFAGTSVSKAARSLEERHGVRAEQMYQHALRGFVIRA